MRPATGRVAERCGYRVGIGWRAKFQNAGDCEPFGASRGRIMPQYCTLWLRNSPPNFVTARNMLPKVWGTITLHPTLVPGKDAGICGEIAKDSCRSREPIVMVAYCNRPALSCEWAARRASDTVLRSHTLLHQQRNLPTGGARARASTYRARGERRREEIPLSACFARVIAMESWGGGLGLTDINGSVVRSAVEG